MVPRDEIRQAAETRLADAEALLAANRYDGAVYLCGYAVELALKARICATLDWREYPVPDKNYFSFKTHNLDVLLHLSGVEGKVKAQLFTEWSAVAQWDPEARYKAPGNATRADTELMIEAAKSLLREL